MKCKECGTSNKDGIKKCLKCKNYIGVCPHCLEESTFVTGNEPFFSAFFRRLGYGLKRLAVLEVELQEGYLICMNCKNDILICSECYSPMLPTQIKCNVCDFIRTIGIQKLVQVFQGTNKIRGKK